MQICFCCLAAQNQHYGVQLINCLQSYFSCEIADTFDHCKWGNAHQHHLVAIMWYLPDSCYCE